MSVTEGFVALIAHDQRKDALVEFIREHRDYFAGQRLVATDSTGTRLHSELGLNVTKVTHGPLGGDLMIGSMIVQGDVKAVFFFRDPLTAQPHEPDVTALLQCATFTVFRWRPIAAQRSA